MNTNQPGTKRYEAEFKRQTVELLLRTGRALKPFAREMGVTPQTLRSWRNAYLKDQKPEGQARSAHTLEAMHAENRRLHQENEQLRMQRDILKKAVGILSDPPPRGMP